MRSDSRLRQVWVAALLAALFVVAASALYAMWATPRLDAVFAEQTVRDALGAATQARAAQSFSEARRANVDAEELVGLYLYSNSARRTPSVTDHLVAARDALRAALDLWDEYDSGDVTPRISDFEELAGLAAREGSPIAPFVRADGTIDNAENKVPQVLADYAVTQLQGALTQIETDGGRRGGLR